ncbi:hypothetical protein VPH35_096766 [Triticum aestivum]
MQNLRRDKIPISLLPSAFYPEKSCNRPPLFWHTGQGRDCGSAVVSVSAVGATPKGAAASGAGGPVEGRCLGRRLHGCKPRAAASPQSSAPRRGWVPPSRAPRLLSAACVVGERLAMRVCAGCRRGHALGGLAPEAAPPHHGWCAGGRCRFIEVRAAPPR